LGNQVFFRGDASRIQRARQGAGQSPAYAGDHVIQCGRKFGALDLTTVLVLIEVLDTPVDPEVDRLREIFHVSGPMGSLVLLDANSTGMGY
jgi:hypothetical protein